MLRWRVGSVGTAASHLGADPAYCAPMDLDELAQRVARLEALEDIRRVAHGYCVGADHRDEARWLDAWTRDAVWQVSPDCTMTGHDEILAGVQMQWAHFRQMQHGTVNHTIDIAHDEAADEAARGRGRLVRASGRADVLVHVQLPDLTWITGGGTYVDEYRCEEGRWRIARRVVRDAFDLAALAPGNGSIVTDRDP